MDIIPQIRTKILRSSTDLAEYQLYRAGLEWDLTEPIVIESREDLRSESRWRNRVEPYHHQVTNLITFCRRLPVTLLADDVGLGKTISAGLVVSELIARGRVSKILIVCPKLLIPQWQEELDTKFGIPSIGAVGGDLLKAKILEDAGAIITTYHSARLHLDALAKKGFDMLILDEAHKLRNLYGVDPPPQVAVRFRKALAERMFKYVLMLTATPIHNRLWDLYSLVDLLAVARGHDNPFGSEGMFARKFIADAPAEARHLKPAMKDEFRSIVYSYMSRIRRADANLHFPERIVQMHKVEPTSEEIELIDTISEPIQKLNRLAQISILQALISSPHALAAQLNGMARKGTIGINLAKSVQEIVGRIKSTAKLKGLETLVENLRKELPEGWRMIVFTCRRETQTTIQAFLEERGIPCDVINGDSGARNQETIRKLKTKPPEINVIVSTEAGSEGVNLQAANVLVNYDLPWNPMIVEQRIGRVQRLASEHAKVCIFNITLRGTFEEYIVGRLMEKLQLASHAIGDVEALLEGSGMDDNEDNGTTGFEEMIRRLVIESLAGKDIEAATRSAEKSIAEAKLALEREEKNINAMLGGMDNFGTSPQCPKLPDQEHAMGMREFVTSALKSLGANLSSHSSGFLLSELGRQHELIRFDDQAENSNHKSVLYAPGTPAFERLVTRITGDGMHLVEDIDGNTGASSRQIAQDWLKTFGGSLESVNILEVWQSFDGSALMRIRATVAHDSYERLIEVNCPTGEHTLKTKSQEVKPVNSFIENPSEIGIFTQKLAKSAMLDAGISEFSRFYLERREQEVLAAGDDERKRKKLEDEFTPRLEIGLVGVHGNAYRQLRVEVNYKLEAGPTYSSFLTLVPSRDELVWAPEMRRCFGIDKSVPEDCIGKCEISGTETLKHLLLKSDISGRVALPENALICALSGKRVLVDEVEKSAITGKLIATSLLKTSILSGKRAEPIFFATCAFSGTEVLQSELTTSQVSNKKYRIDQQAVSAVSGKTGHQQEFIVCTQTNQRLLSIEAEHCEVTSKAVMPGLLEQCVVSGKKVLPSELEKSTMTGKQALRRYFVDSGISGARILQSEAIQSVSGNFCTVVEARDCSWSGLKSHPDDLKVCQLTGKYFRSEYTTMKNSQVVFEPLINLLDGSERHSDNVDSWTSIATITSDILRSKNCKVEGAQFSPNKEYLAVVLEVRTFLGFVMRQVGLLYSLKEKTVAGRIAKGKRGASGWVAV